MPKAKGVSQFVIDYMGVQAIAIDPALRGIPAYIRRTRPATGGVVRKRIYVTSIA